ncbi:MAG: argininosuccinate lyase [Pirellulales bacterium]|nr:argininosuccinate lyase [Pirellulales bacterium]
MAESPLSRSGVFSKGPDAALRRFTESVSFDRRLAEYDIQGSLAHAEMLQRQGLISANEWDVIRQGLAKIGDEIAAGKFAWREELEDVHMNIEQALIERIGDTGRKLHTARSRNDQVSTDMRLWARAAIEQINAQLLALQQAFVERCAADLDVIVPAYTHLRRAQPVSAAHYWLAYCEKFERDRQRLNDCRKRVNQCPLGTAAAAGTSIPIDRQATASTLGFEGIVANSLDSSSDRDFLVEFVFDLSLVAAHLSGWAEEWILWSGVEFDFLQLPEEFCTGSSIMPQKINPDVLEIIRGKTARVYGALSSLLMLVKGLPLAYNRDLQEDKPPVFDAFDTVLDSLELAAPLVRGAALKPESIAARLDEGYLDATTLMEFLIAQGIPQRTAHHQVGALVRQAMAAQVRLANLPLADFQAIDPSIDEAVYQALGAKNAAAAFVSTGSGSPAEVGKQAALWRERLASNSGYSSAASGD